MFKTVLYAPLIGSNLAVKPTVILAEQCSVFKCFCFSIYVLSPAKFVLAIAL